MGLKVGIHLIHWMGRSRVQQFGPLDERTKGAWVYGAWKPLKKTPTPSFSLINAKKGVEHLFGFFSLGELYLKVTTTFLVTPLDLLKCIIVLMPFSLKNHVRVTLLGPYNPFS